MPNPLAHFGVQGVATRLILRDADPKWIYLGGVLPDLPGIARRATELMLPGVDRIDLRMYETAQATLAGSLLLAGALAALARRPLQVFAVLGFNVALHLLLDGCQIRWGGGVQLLAPFAWETWSFGVFWPGSWPVWVLSLFGLGYVVYAWIRRVGPPVMPAAGVLRMLAGLVLLAGYAILPLRWAEEAEAADTLFASTLRAPRAGLSVGLDHARIEPAADGLLVHAWTGQSFRVAGDLPIRGADVSLRGVFRDAETIEVTSGHEHTGRGGVVAAWIGFGLLLLVWMRDLWPLVRALPAAGFPGHALSLFSISRVEALRLGHDWIGTEHILLAMTREEDGPASRALRALGIDLEALRKRVLALLRKGKIRTVPRQMPFTPLARAALELALDELVMAEGEKIDSGHLLIALARLEEGIVATVFRDLDLDAARVRAALAPPEEPA